MIEPDDEVLTDGGIPRWVGWVAVLTVVAVLAGLVVTHLPAEHSHPAASKPRPPANPAVPVTAAPDVAKGTDTTWVLRDDALLSVEGPRVVARLSLQDLHLSGTPRLAVDAAAHTVWIVVTNAVTGRMVEYDERTLRKLRDLTWRQLVQSAVAYRGHLYLQNDFGVADLAPGATRPRFIAGLSGAVGPLAVDPTRHRLIAIDLGYPTDVWSYRPGHRPVEARQPLDLSKGTLAVVDGTIWVGAFAGSGGAVLERLDPRTLRPIRHAAGRPFDPGAVIVGDGARVLWVRPDSGSDMLACVGARSGRIEQQWRLRDVAAVTSGPDGALAATPSGVLGLIMADCRG